MTNSTLSQSSARFRLAWLPGVFFRPRRTFAEITQAGGHWLAPMLLLSLTGLLLVFANGWVTAQAAQMGELPLPPNFEYFTPDQQTQYMQALQARQSPAFLYGLPALGMLAGVWAGWMLVGGLLHLVTTLLGGRGDTQVAMNLVAWGALPLALRDLVRLVYTLSTGQSIQSSGLAGFITDTSGGWAFLAALLALVDIYIIWHICLLWIGTRSSTNLSPAKASLAVFITIGLALAAQALLGYAVIMLSNLSVTQPYFF